MGDEKMGSYPSAKLFFGAIYPPDVGDNLKLPRNDPSVMACIYGFGDGTSEYDTDTNGIAVVWKESYFTDGANHHQAFDMPRFDEDEARKRIEEYCKKNGLPWSQVSWYIMSYYG